MCHECRGKGRPNVYVFIFISMFILWFEFYKIRIATSDDEVYVNTFSSLLSL